MNDLMYAVRLVRRAPQYAAIVLVTLALGIGGNAAVFAIVNAVLFRPLPFRDAEQLVQIWNRMPQSGVEEMTIAPADYLDFRARARSFSDLAAHNVWFPTVGDASAAERVSAGVVTSNLFFLLGVRPELGRDFREGEDRARDRVVMLSHAAWQRRFGGDPDVLGKTLLIAGVPYEVVGVLPASYRHPDPHEPLSDAEFFAPISFTAASAARGSQFLRVVGRLRDGVTLEQGTAELRSIASQLAAEHPATNHDRTITAVSLRENFVHALERPLLIAQLAALLVLLIACANIANLVMVRGHLRRREFAIRSSIGATRGQLTRQLLIEGAVLASLGGGLALLCVLAGMRALRALEGRFIPVVASVSIDGVVLGFTFALSVITAVIFGLVPLLDVRHSGTRTVLAEEAAGAGTSAGALRLRHGLVVAEVALAVALVVGTGVLARSFLELRKVQPGFEPASVLTFEAVLPPLQYPDTASTHAFFSALHERMKTIPGVSSAALISDLPLTSENRSIDLRAEGAARSRETQTDFQVVSGDYFETMRIPLLDGRTFTGSDGAGVAIIGEALARRLWPGANPLGRRIHTNADAPVIVIGVVGDVIDQSLTAGTKPLLYLTPAAQPQRRMSVVARTTVPELSLVSALRRAVRELDPAVAVVDVRTMNAVVEQQLGSPRFAATLSTVFSTLALALATLGVYGVLAFAVSARTREIGIRTALGANARAVGRMILRQGLVLVLPGTMIGILLGIMTTRLLSRFLFGVSALDPASLVLAATVPVLAGFLAGWGPARRAIRISPMQALH